MRMELDAQALVNAMQPTMKRLGVAYAAEAGQNINEGKAGGDAIPELDWPRLDGTTDHPLKGNGKLVRSLSGDAILADGTVLATIESDHPGALHLLLGTMGKGGQLAPIHPRTQDKMVFAVYSATAPRRRRMVETTEVNFKPRNYLAMTKDKTSAIVSAAAK